VALSHLKVAAGEVMAALCDRTTQQCFHGGDPVRGGAQRAAGNGRDIFGETLFPPDKYFKPGKSMAGPYALQAKHSRYGF